MEIEQAEYELLKRQNESLKNSRKEISAYIYEKINQLLDVMGTPPLAPEEFDEESIVSLDPIGLLSATFTHVIEHLRTTRERLDVTLRSIGDGVITTDMDGNIVMINPAAERLTGWTQEAAAGRPVEDVVKILHGQSYEMFESPVKMSLESGSAVSLADETVLLDRNGNRRDISDSCAPILDAGGKPVGAVFVFQDITEKKKLQEELLRTQKLESVGILAGGIAHDFNNLLTSILGNISVSLSHINQDDIIHTRLLKSEKACLRAKDLTQQLLTLSRGSVPIKKAASIAELLKDSTELALRGSNVRCLFSLPYDLWRAEIDPGQISQVFTNLVLNADQAMPGGGCLRIAAENFTFDADGSLPLKTGEYIKISFSDEGLGISAENIKRIFDPYFTTKQEGTGLGLAVTYSIILKHGGHINVDSEQAKGAVFTVYLPAVPKAPHKNEQEADVLIRGSGRILIMDDEPIVSEIAGDMLNMVGYEVDFAANGEEAIEAYRKAKDEADPFTLVIMDLTIPGGMGGREAIIKLLDYDPDIKAVVSSGYSEDPVVADFRTYGFCGAVVKPYKVRELSRAVHKAITQCG